MKEKHVNEKKLRWGKQTEQIDMTLNVEQAVYTRDAWVKAIYSRMFDFLGEKILKRRRGAIGIFENDVLKFSNFSQIRQRRHGDSGKGLGAVDRDFGHLRIRNLRSQWIRAILVGWKSIKSSQFSVDFLWKN